MFQFELVELKMEQSYSNYYGSLLIEGLILNVDYRRSGSVRIKNISSVKISQCLIFVALAYQ